MIKCASNFIIFHIHHINIDHISNGEFQNYILFFYHHQNNQINIMSMDPTLHTHDSWCGYAKMDSPFQTTLAQSGTWRTIRIN